MTGELEPPRGPRSGADLGFELDDEAWLARVGDAASSEPRPTTGRLGDYELLASAGRGGQGVVFRARQPHTGRIVALKRLNAGAFATAEMRARFLREIEAASTLEHPHIVAIHGCELLEDGPVAVMQWIDGEPLDRWAARNSGPEHRPRVVELIAKVAEAVSHAHQRGVVHRDLKPSNILVDANDEPHVVDFGLAKFHSGERADASLTESGVFVGTLHYAAPELALGSRSGVDVRSDVYALGVVLHQALTGRLPFDPPTSLAELVEHFARREPRRPSLLVADLDRDLDAITLKALASEPEQRYASMSEFAADLRRHLAGEVVLAHPPTTRYRIQKLVRRHKIAVSAAGAFVLFLAGASVLSTSLYFAAERERVRADDALEAERERANQLEKAQRETQRERIRQGAGDELLQRLLERATAGALSSPTPVTLRSALDAVAAQVPASSAQLEDEGEAWLHMNLGDTYLDLRDTRAAAPHFERALELRRALFPGPHLDVAESLERLGRARRGNGDLHGALAAQRESLAMRRALLPDNDGYLAVGTNSLGVLLRNMGRPAEAEALLTDALRRYFEAFTPSHVSVPIVQRNLALTYHDLGRTEEALELCELALARTIEINGDEHPDVALCRVERARYCDALGRSEQAAALLERVMEVLLANQGDRHKTYLQARAQLALLRGATEPIESERVLRELVEIQRERGDTLMVLQCLNSLAKLLAQRGELERSETELREALCEAERAFGPLDVPLAAACLALAEHLHADGRVESARELATRASAAIHASGNTSSLVRLSDLK